MQLPPSETGVFTGIKVQRTCCKIGREGLTLLADWTHAKVGDRAIIYPEANGVQTKASEERHSLDTSRH